jgi:hypothetical protein
VRIRGSILLGSALLLAACTSAVDGAGTDNVLEGLGGQRLCELLPKETVEQKLGVVIADAKGSEIGVIGRRCSYSVDFDTLGPEEEVPRITIGLEDNYRETVDDILDYTFADDPAARPMKVTDYQRVDGLGEAAGYGFEPSSGAAESQLAVVFAVGEELLNFEVQATPPTPLEKLQPLATELLAALETELR